MPARISILPDETIATVRPEIFGHFAEHLGGCVNEGIWVGPDSPIPNIGGLRSDIVEAWRAISPPVLRWPGGCFADDYHWRDGIGPRRDRPKTVNIWWGQTIEDNAFGTHEFIDLCRLIGAQPYLAGNLGSGTVREMRDWVEYCNFERPSTLAMQRAGNGSPMPFGVKYWGVGNEAWGCGGNFCPQDYAREYRRYATYLRDLGSTELFLVACGPDGNKPEWTTKFFTTMAGADKRFNCRIHGFGSHYYCGTAGTATEYSVDQWYELLERAAAVESLLHEQRAVMDEFDPDRRIGLVIDEWGTWHPPTPARNPAFLWQQNTVRDALVAAITLNAFVRNADKVIMANLAQSVNVLQSLFLTEGDKLVLTPTYHVFDLLKSHQGGRAVRVEIDSPTVLFAAGDQKRVIPALSGAASISGRELTLSIVNAHARLPVDAKIDCGATVSEGVTSMLGGGDIHTLNTFDQPDSVKAQVQGGQRDWDRWAFPPASLTVLRLKLP